ncbi:MAG: phosphatase PAP2 family protein [Fimbriimonadaceae bacterium]|nr:phosphatase PAP2 family protein [Fimbriimonadaceae bacterium]QYK55094.1 MAG: phosphatase PAP2 family protein [Fimbriimonadaceae bacterium]
MNALDRAVFDWINRWPESLSGFFVFFSLGIKLLGVRIGFLLVVLALLYRKETRKALFLALASWPLANGLTEALKYGLQWPRPSGALADMVDAGHSLASALAAHPEVVVRVEPLGSFGTASSHAANMAALATVFTMLHGKWGWPWIAIALVTGVSRIYVGVHWPSQVLLGWACGVFCGVLTVRTFEAGSRLWQGRRRSREPLPD